MDSINQLELQNIRHIHGFSSNICDKIEYYKTLTSDDSVNKLLDKICTNMTNIQNDLTKIL